MLKYVIPLLIIVIMLSCVFTVLSVPAYGLGEIELTLGGTGSSGLNLQNVAPGASGSVSVDLRSDGSLDGWVIIWVSDISSTEGANPESESGNTAEPGELINYLFFSCAASGLETNIALPVTLYSLPQSATDTDYIRLPLNTRETVTLSWSWQFVDTGQPQNDAQGDSVSFTFNYLLVDEIEAVENDVQSGTSNLGYYYTPVVDSQSIDRQLDVDILGEESSVGIDSSGRLIQSLAITSPDFVVQLELEQGTAVTGSDGSAITKLELRAIDNPVPPPEGMKIVGKAYEIIGYTEDSVATSVVFNRPVGLKLSYYPDWLPEEKSSLHIATLDKNGNWQKYEGMFIANQPRVITTTLTGSTVMAIMAYLLPGEEAGGLTPITSDPGEPEPVQSIATDAKGGAADSPNSGTMTTPIQSDPKIRYTITNAATIEKSKRVSFWVMVGGMAVLGVLLYLKRRRDAFYY